MGSYPSTPQPEILPPPANSLRLRRAGAVLRGRLRRPLICSWASIAAYFWPWCCAAQRLDADSRPVHALGRRQAGNVLIDGEWWRIVTAMFVHVGILHLATNMWCLWNLGLLAEPLMGSFGLFAVYILTGAAGNLLSTAYNWMFPIHDASGALYFQAGAGARARSSASPAR